MILDIIILIILVAAAVTGYRRGVISQFGAVLAVVVALIICRLGGDACTEAFAREVGANDPSQSGWNMYTAGIVANVILFIVVWLAVRIVCRLLRRIIHAVLLGPVDAFAGAVFRVLAWTLAISIVLNIWLVMSPSSQVIMGQRSYGRLLIDSVLGFGPWLWGQIQLATAA